MATHGHALLLSGELVEAERVVRESIALGSKLYGARHYNNTSRMSKLVAILRAQARHVEAAALANEIVAIRRTSLPPHHPMLMFALHGASRQNLLAGQTDQAHALVEESLRRYRERDGADAPAPVGTELLRVEILIARKDTTAAEELLAAIEARGDALKPQHRTDLQALRQRLRDRPLQLDR